MSPPSLRHKRQTSHATRRARRKPAPPLFCALLTPIGPRSLPRRPRTLPLHPERALHTLEQLSNEAVVLSRNFRPRIYRARAEDAGRAHRCAQVWRQQRRLTGCESQEGPQRRAARGDRRHAGALTEEAPLLTRKPLLTQMPARTLSSIRRPFATSVASFLQAGMPETGESPRRAHRTRAGTGRKGGVGRGKEPVFCPAHFARS